MGETLGAMAVGQEAVVTNAVEAVRQRVEEEAANELAGFEGHDLDRAAVAIILPGKVDLAPSSARRRELAMATRWV